LGLGKQCTVIYNGGGEYRKQGEQPKTAKKVENIGRGWSTYLGPIPLLNYL
jgi:hypothetical protein